MIFQRLIQPLLDSQPMECLLDRSIYYSFDRSGFKRHQRRFNPEDLNVDLRSQVCLITGGTSGLGFAAAQQLLRLGAKVTITGRNLEKGQKALELLKKEGHPQSVFFEPVDHSDLSSIRAFVDRWSEQRVDVLIHNAGLIAPALEKTPQGLEVTLATHVVGAHLLTELLLPRLKKSPSARVIWVSSGGMYLQRLNLEQLNGEREPFDGVKAYANTKRAQVILNELWAERLKDSSVSLFCMHPGWAATPGVEKSLPGFWKWMQGRLRTPEEGADTIVWLAACPGIQDHRGKFWLDRKEVPPYLFSWTVESPQDRAKLWERCQNWISPFLS
ncbi:MAG: SDR family NAD(P)-dependent oxidoreductase [Bdellovibrionia bacterium]